MERITISLSDGLAREFDELMRAKSYENRSEAVRDLLRSALEAHRLESNDAPYCVGILSYVYNHHERVLAQRMTEHAHEHHDIVISTMHAHLDHENCIETMLLQGRTDDVRKFGEAVIASPGVRHGKVQLIPVDRKGVHTHRHVHARPTT